MFIKGRPLNDFGLQCIVRFWYELPRKRFDDSRRVDAVRQEIVERSANLKEPLGRALFNDLAGNLLDERFPVWRWDVCLICNLLTSYVSDAAVEYVVTRETRTSEHALLQTSKVPFAGCVHFLLLSSGVDSRHLSTPPSFPPCSAHRKSQSL
jgi:hypothetical protein